MDVPEPNAVPATPSVPAQMKLMDIHSIVTLIGSLTVTAFIFVHPTGLGLLDIAGAYALLNGGQTIGALGKGGQRALQGGSTAPDKIIPPSPNGV